MVTGSKIERVLVVGATGFVGRHIVQALKERDVEVVGLRRWNSDPGVVAGLGVPTLVADLLDPAELLEVMPGFNYIVMAAAPRPKVLAPQYMKQAALGMRNLLATCREVQVERVIVTSSATTIARPAAGELASAAAVYLPGDPGPALERARHLRAARRRIDAQYAAELECFRQAADGLDLRILCPGICVGDDAVLPVRALLGGLPERARVNLVDVKAVARAHASALLDRDEDPFSGELFSARRYALGGENITIGELYRRLEPAGSGERSLGGYRVQLSDDPAQVRVLDQLGADLWLDASRAQRELNFSGALRL